MYREPAGAACRFTITPLRHYPLQQPGVSPVGVLPPVKWDSFRKKNVLSPRNSPAALSPVTVKIARPDHHNSSPRYKQSHIWLGVPQLQGWKGSKKMKCQTHGGTSFHLKSFEKWVLFYQAHVLTCSTRTVSFNIINIIIVWNSVDHLSCAEVPRPTLDPCSRESVLKVLKESRKRDVEDEDRIFAAEQRSKRRYMTFCPSKTKGSRKAAYGTSENRLNILNKITES